MPHVIVIAGANGAGKSTVAPCSFARDEKVWQDLRKKYEKDD